MPVITTIGLDIAKSVVQVHAVDADGKVILRRQLKRRYARQCPAGCADSPGKVAGTW